MKHAIYHRRPGEKKWLRWTANKDSADKTVELWEKYWQKYTHMEWALFEIENKETKRFVKRLGA